VSDSENITTALIVECVLIDVFVAVKLLLWRIPLQFHDMFVVFLHVEIFFSYLTLMTRLGILSWHMCAGTWQQVFVPH
jgi:hypothetical protein